MTNFTSGCETCNEAIEIIEQATYKFLALLSVELISGNKYKHIAPSTLILFIMGHLGDALEATLELDTDSIMQRESLGTIEERKAIADKLTDKIVKGCFDILQDALPIDIHAHGGMTKEAASKVADMVNAMSNKNDSGVTH